MVKHRLTPFFSLLVLGVLLLAACGPAAPPEPPAATEAPGGEPTEVTDVDSTEPTEPTDDDSSTPPTSSDEPYSVGIFEDLTTVNYWAYLGPDSSVWNGYFLGPQATTMLGFADKTYALVPMVAASLPERPLTQEGEFYVSEIPIKDTITWNDGTPLTANDVAFTANTVLDLQLPGNWATFINSDFLDRVEAVDDYTVKYYYTQDPGLAVHEYGTLNAPVMSEAYWAPIVQQAREAVGALNPPAEDAPEADQEAYQASLSEALNILYSHDPQDEPRAGAFTYARWEPGAFAESSANPDYYRSGAQVRAYADGTYEEVKDGSYEVMVGEPASEVVVEYTVGPFVPSTIYTLYSDQNAALLALQQGEIDFILNSLGLQRGLRSQVEGQEEVEVIDNPTNGFRYISFNAREAPMSDTAFRQAVAVLIDKEFVTQQILQGVANPIYSFIPAGNAFWYYNDVPKFGLNEDGTPMTREERINEAIRILEEAGYSFEGDQKPTWDEENREVVTGGTLILPDGNVMEQIEMLAPGPGYDPLRSTFAVWVEQWLNEFGIPMRANLTGFNVIQDRVFDQQDFDMYMLGWSVTIFPDYVRDFFHSDRAAAGDFNAGGFNNPEFDQLADGIKSCTTFEECREIANDIQTVLAEELPYIVIFDTDITEVYASRLTYPVTETLDGLQNLYGLPESVLVE